jgi:glyoxylase-like metal-dependent hydrolase (beta-lactamase superfamily II)
MVLHTHLHADHVGWGTHLVGGAWVPTFPNARYVYVGAELDYWRAGEQRTEEDVYADSVAPIVERGLADIVDADANLGDGLRFVPTPGHTPGHVALEVATNTEPLFITGDLIHHPAQFACPQWSEIADYDVAQARETRRAFVDAHAAAGTLLAGTHFPVRPVGRAVADGAVWRFEPVMPS